MSNVKRLATMKAQLCDEKITSDEVKKLIKPFRALRLTCDHSSSFPHYCNLLASVSAYSPDTGRQLERN